MTGRKFAGTLLSVTLTTVIYYYYDNQKPGTRFTASYHVTNYTKFHSTKTAGLKRPGSPMHCSKVCSPFPMAAVINITENNGI